MVAGLPGCARVPAAGGNHDPAGGRPGVDQSVGDRTAVVEAYDRHLRDGAAAQCAAGADHTAIDLSRTAGDDALHCGLDGRGADLRGLAPITASTAIFLAVGLHAGTGAQ